jgi:hypothetical protein
MGIALLTIFPRFYPLYPITNLPVAFVMVFLASLMMSWAGAALGNYFATDITCEEDATAYMRLPLKLLGVGVAMVAFIIFFVTTATPPA